MWDGHALKRARARVCVFTTCRADTHSGGYALGREYLPRVWRTITHNTAAQQTPAPDPDVNGNEIEEVEVVYTLAYKASDNGIEPNAEEFATIFDADQIKVYTEDWELAGNYTLELIGTYSFANGRQTNV